MSFWTTFLGLLSGLVDPAAVLRPQSAPQSRPEPAPARREPRLSISGEALGRAAHAHRKNPGTSSYDPERVRALFRPAEPMPGVVPKQKRREVMLAMDQELTTGLADPAMLWPMLGSLGSLSDAGNLAWMGYPYLAELSQRSEYRQLTETTAMEMTRRWVKISSNSEEDKGDRVRALNDAMEHYKLQAVFRRMAEIDGFFGRGQLYIDDGSDQDDRELLMSPLIDDARSLRKLKRFTAVEPAWTYPGMYDAINPLSAEFYNPRTWYVMGKEVHRSRLMTFVMREVPDLLKPAYSFGGISLTQLCKPAVDNFLRTRQSVSDLVHSFNVPVLLSQLGAVLQGGGGEQETQRAMLFNYLRDNLSLMMVDKDSEDFKFVSAPLGTLDALQAQAQEQIAMPAHMPLVILAGLTPHGLNASSEGEVRVWEAWVLASQMHLFGPRLKRCLDIIQLVEFGDIDPSIKFDFEPLHEQDAMEHAQIGKVRADTIAVYDQMGAIGPQEVREAVAADEDLPFSNIDVSKVAPGEEDRELQHQQLEQGMMGGGGESQGPPQAAQDAEFEESEHPRDPEGKFAQSEGGGKQLKVKPNLSGKSQPESAWHETSWYDLTPEFAKVIANVRPLNAVRQDNRNSAYYDGITHVVNLPGANDPMNQTVWRHEFGHAIDRQAAGGRGWASVALMPTIEVEGKVARKGPDLTNDRGSWPRSGDGAHSMMHDFISALTKGKYGNGHSRAYWKNPDNPPVELFANYVALTTGQKSEVWGAMLRNLAPKTCEGFDQILRRMGGGV